MSRTCTVCRHPKRSEIDRAITEGAPFRDIANRYGPSKAAVQRHKPHVTARIAQALTVQETARTEALAREIGTREAHEVVRAEDLLGQVRHLHGKALAVLARAEQDGDGRLAIMAVREATNTLRLLGEILGELQQGAQVNVLVLPEWFRLRSTVIEALVEFPEARAAVVGALRRLGDGAGAA